MPRGTTAPRLAVTRRGRRTTLHVSIRHSMARSEQRVASQVVPDATTGGGTALRAWGGVRGK